MSMRASLAGWLLVASGLFTGVGRADLPADEVERLRQEIKALKDAVAAQQKQIVELREAKRLQQELQAIRDRAVAAEIQAAALKRRNEQLLEELEKTVRELRKLKDDKQAAPPARSAPVEQVEGLVKTVDPSGLVKINIGKDTGLERGHTLEVFRIDADPKSSRYLGRIRIVEVTKTEAIGQVVGKVSAPIQAGDRVASKIEADGKK